MTVSSDGKRVASGSWDRTVKLWDGDRGTLVLSLKGHGDTVASVALGPDGTRVVSGSTDQMVKLWDAARGAELLSLFADVKGVNSVAASADGKRVVSGGADGTVKVWPCRCSLVAGSFSMSGIEVHGRWLPGISGFEALTGARINTNFVEGGGG